MLPVCTDEAAGCRSEIGHSQLFFKQIRHGDIGLPADWQKEIFRAIIKVISIGDSKRYVNASYQNTWNFRLTGEFLPIVRQIFHRPKKGREKFLCPSDDCPPSTRW
jgi:hypothetical protein